MKLCLIPIDNFWVDYDPNEAVVYISHKLICITKVYFLFKYPYTKNGFDLVGFLLSFHQSWITAWSKLHISLTDWWPQHSWVPRIQQNTPIWGTKFPNTMMEVMESRCQLFLFVPKYQVCKARKLWSQKRAVCTTNLPRSKKTQLLEV